MSIFPLPSSLPRPGAMFSSMLEGYPEAIKRRAVEEQGRVLYALQAVGTARAAGNADAERMWSETAKDLEEKLVDLLIRAAPKEPVPQIPPVPASPGAEVVILPPGYFQKAHRNGNAR